MLFSLTIIKQSTEIFAGFVWKYLVARFFPNIIYSYSQLEALNWIKFVFNEIYRLE